MRPIIQSKIKQVEELTDKIKGSSSVVIVNYRGLTVEEITNLRSNLREVGCEMKVIKNNILRRAFEGAGQKEISELMIGPNAIAFGGEDAVAPAKVLADFAKKHKALELKAGVVENEYCDEAEIKAIASIPGREGLLTMLAGGMLAPLRDLAIGLHLYTEENAE